MPFKCVASRLKNIMYLWANPILNEELYYLFFSNFTDVLSFIDSFPHLLRLHQMS